VQDEILALLELRWISPTQARNLGWDPSANPSLETHQYVSLNKQNLSRTYLLRQAYLRAIEAQPGDPEPNWNEITFVRHDTDPPTYTSQTPDPETGNWQYRQLHPFPVKVDEEEVRYRDVWQAYHEGLITLKRARELAKGSVPEEMDEKTFKRERLGVWPERLKEPTQHLPRRGRAVWPDMDRENPSGPSPSTAGTTSTSTPGRREHSSYLTSRDWLGLDNGPKPSSASPDATTGSC